MSSAIRITDLAVPQLNAMQKAALAAVPPVELDAETVLATARAATGLTDFGAEDFRERLDIWLESFNADLGLSRFGRATVFGECVRYATTRLKFADLMKRHPEIDAIDIDRPIMIAGLPRSGTTHLVNILSNDPRLRSTQLWELSEPIPGPNDVGDPDPRFVRTAQSWGLFEALLPHIKAMHPMAPDHVHEDIDLQGVDFSSYLPEWFGRVYRWRDYYLSHDQTPHYAYAKRLMKAITWHRGPNRWLTKSPPHMENFGALLAVHPRAIVPITHRDPVAVIQSIITMVAYGDRIRRTQIDLKDLADWWIFRIERLLRRCVRDRELLPAKQGIDILFHDYMADQKATIAMIYERAEIEMTPEAEARIDRFLGENPRGKYGTVHYNIKEDFGIDIGELRERFQFYYDRFPVKKERINGERT